MIFRLPWLAILIVLPLLELYLLIKLGQWIGAIPAVFLVVFTAVLGALLIRYQGLLTLNRVRTSLQRGEEPATALFEGAALLVGGILLMLPGILTDAVGLLALAPVLRRWAIRRFLRSWRAGHRNMPTQRGPETIDGDFRRED